jgi:hypothetical protein
MEQKTPADWCRLHLICSGGVSSFKINSPLRKIRSLLLLQERKLHSKLSAERSASFASFSLSCLQSLNFSVTAENKLCTSRASVLTLQNGSITNSSPAGKICTCLINLPRGQSKRARHFHPCLIRCWPGLIFAAVKKAGDYMSS